MYLGWVSSDLDKSKEHFLNIASFLRATFHYTRGYLPLRKAMNWICLVIKVLVATLV